MKKVIILLSLFSLFNKVNSQSSILVTDLANSSTVAPNAIILESTTASSKTSHVFDIKNNSLTNKSYDIKRYDMILNSNATSTAEAYFCFAGACYGSAVMTSITSLTLTAGQSASQIQGSFNTLTTDLDEASTVGYSLIKYTVINATNASDSTQFSIKYNAPSGINDNYLSFAKMDIFPNPAKDNFTVKLNFKKNEKSNVVIFNSIGCEVFSTEVYLTEGTNFVPININNLNTGVYFLKIVTNDGFVTKKLIID
jgi:hypothetical protein